jgi:hypothetical protein
MTTKTAAEALEELRQKALAAKAVALGEWTVDSSISDTGPLFYSVYCGKYVLVDTLNSDAAEVSFECDEDGSIEWDEVGKRTTAYIAAASPEVILALLDELAQLRAHPPATEEGREVAQEDVVQPLLPAGINEAAMQLMRFYGVDDFQELACMQNRQIELLQEKLRALEPKMPIFTTPREG